MYVSRDIWMVGRPGSSKTGLLGSVMEVSFTNLVRNYLVQIELPKLLWILTSQGLLLAWPPVIKNVGEEVMAPYHTVTILLPSGSGGNSSLKGQYSSLQGDTVVTEFPSDFPG